jgi:UDP-GlcNAc:undecaprenyl-phosphate/decaprenyl-phosphate GlcNAc-1-phosphate transferase
MPIFFLVFITALVVSLGLTPLAARLAVRTGAVDLPAPRRVHDKPMPRFGGLPIFVAFVAAVGVSLVYPRSDPNEMTRLAGLLLGCTLVFAVGAIDDYHELRALPQLVTQIIAAGIAVGSGVLILEIPNPFGGLVSFETWFAILFTLFWLVGTMNTVNWLDGIDGLAGGVIVIASAVMFIHTYNLGQHSLALLALALAGTVLGFLPFNFFPARIFLGSAGANVLGFTLGVLSIIGGAKVATALLVLGIPILDVAWQILSRLRAHRSPFAADRGHLHHRLLDLGLSQRTIVVLYYTFTAFFGALALILPSGEYKLVALVVIGIGALLVLVKIGHQKQIVPPR